MCHKTQPRGTCSEEEGGYGYHHNCLLTEYWEMLKMIEEAREGKFDDRHSIRTVHGQLTQFNKVMTSPHYALRERVRDNFLNLS